MSQLPQDGSRQKPLVCLVCYRYRDIGELRRFQSGLLESLETVARVEARRDLIAATLERYEAIVALDYKGDDDPLETASAITRFLSSTAGRRIILKFSTSSRPSQLLQHLGLEWELCLTAELEFARSYRVVLNARRATAQGLLNTQRWDRGRGTWLRSQGNLRT